MAVFAIALPLPVNFCDHASSVSNLLFALVSGPFVDVLAWRESMIFQPALHKYAVGRNQFKPPFDAPSRKACDVFFHVQMWLPLFELKSSLPHGAPFYAHFLRYLVEYSETAKEHLSITAFVSPTDDLLTEHGGICRHPIITGLRRDSLVGVGDRAAVGLRCVKFNGAFALMFALLRGTIFFHPVGLFH
ncbi:hypothetical protein CfE428DRAFT_4002 [Chthoniobacter flavus Ellin428]|uniref:Uncharacterized protein n=1 Tax=Chthoniobacter flavus Ellin428 TaxID=497964 RepID=B4D513_9BACT|nr:hypothetical protein CfE428DRAFT_4002 [Chthoniobacter flavus Ellin428]TCO90928.1 hypothetical protein EV701_10977 [Chthoniobacter flavus]